MVFRLVVFRPFRSEVIIAKVKSSDEDGIRRAFFKKKLLYMSKVLMSQIFSVTVGFFDDMYIPTAFLPQPSALYVSISNLSIFIFSFLNHLNTSDPNERCHFWMSESTLTSSAELLDTPIAERMYIERDEIIRVRVESDEFYDDEPGPPKLAEGVQVKRESKRAPYTVCVSTTTFVVLLLTIFFFFHL